MTLIYYWLSRVNLISVIMTTLSALPFVGFAAALPDNAAILDDQQQLRQQQRERLLQQQNTPHSDVRLKLPQVAVADYPANEQPCFTIHTLQLVGNDASHFQWALAAANDAKNRCLGGKGILRVVNKVQNAILAKGYVTTRVMVQEQDVTKGYLTLTLQPGRIEQIRFVEPVSWRARLWNALPSSPGAILNLRDIEQGLENFRRLPSVAATINIVPGQQEATSDLLVSWRQARPVRLSLALDDGGAKSTGRYLGSATLSIDAPFAQNDLFYANVGKDLFQHGPFGNLSHTVNYFFPFGYWAFSANYNDYNYHQNIPNANEVLSYSGKSNNVQLTLSRLLFRNQQHKLTLNMRGYYRHSTNAVDGINIDNQYRRTAGWELGLNQRSYLANTTLDANLTWHHGTGAFGALPAPAGFTDSDNARAGIALADLTINQPFHLASQPWRYYTSLRGQWSSSRLTPQDRMAIAGRYTVRGFDGEQMLSGEKGLLWRNELAWNVFAQGHELYAAVDYGRVDGANTRYLVGHQLIGSALGVRGNLWSRVNYDLFAGVPLYKPQQFHTAGVAAGFSVSLTI